MVADPILYIDPTLPSVSWSSTDCLLLRAAVVLSVKAIVSVSATAAGLSSSGAVLSACDTELCVLVAQEGRSTRGAERSGTAAAVADLSDAKAILSGTSSVSLHVC